MPSAVEASYPSDRGLTFRAPTLGDEAAAREAHRQLIADGFTFLSDYDDYAAFVAACARDERGVDLPPNWVRGTNRFVFTSDGELVGRVSVRHELNDFLLNIGGHIGYAVLPRFRRRGYATAMLHWGLDLLAAEGVTRALVTCDEDNTGSRRTIENAGGVLEDIRDISEGIAPKRRYWITLP